jgi:hypothetical protein
MARRDVFSAFCDADIVNDEENKDALQSSDHSNRQPLDFIPVAQPRKKRNRDWEKSHQAETVTYRGVPIEIQAWVEKISDSLFVPRDDVVRAFLEYGVDRYKAGQLSLFVYPKAQRMTLYPENRMALVISPTQKTDVNEWLNNAFPTPSKRQNGPGKKQKQNSVLWKVRVTYRIPVVLKEEIRSIAEEHTLPVGEVVWFFIEFALKAFRDGKLPLQPSPKSIGKTLFQDAM